MSNTAIKSVTQDDALKDIFDVLKFAQPKEAPFALVLGAGFSAGLVPTTRELLERDLPVWLHAREHNKDFKITLESSSSEHAQIAREFWARFARRNPIHAPELKLRQDNGLPGDVAEAYKAVFDSRLSGGLNTLALARKFQRDVMRLDRQRLNLAHFFLASLLSMQPSALRGEGFKTRGALSRLILTTNFDPFLQQALQAVNQLYFMSDTPEVGISSDIEDASSDAIHLVYLHGSVHRRKQAASQSEIDDIKHKNAAVLRPILERKGVIVLGYSGWDDVIVEALAKCHNYDYGLYWCGRDETPAQPKFSKKVLDILEKRTARYVKVSCADEFMLKLWGNLTTAAPPLIANPIAIAKHLLESITLEGNARINSEASGDDLTRQDFNQKDPQAVFKEQWRETIDRLGDAERFFLGSPNAPIKPDTVDHPHQVTGSVNPKSIPLETPTKSIEIQSSSFIKTQLSEAKMRLAASQYEEAIKACDEALQLNPASPLELSELYLARAAASAHLNRMDEALVYLSRLIDHKPEAPVNLVARGLVARGNIHALQGAHKKALSDYTRVIDHGSSTFSVEDLIDLPSLVGRLKQQTRPFDIWLATRLSSQTQAALAAYQAPSTDPARLEEVLRQEINKLIQGELIYERERFEGITLRPEVQTFLSQGLLGIDLHHLNRLLVEDAYPLELSRNLDHIPEASLGMVARALVNRGMVYREMGEAEKASSDYTRVIDEMPDASVGQLARALINRGVLYGEQKERDRALSDYTRVIEKMPETPVEHLARALINRGILYGEQKEPKKALSDYTRLVDDLPGAPVGLVADALFNRALVYEQQGEPEKALSNYTRLVENLPGAPVGRVADALFNRALVYEHQREPEKALSDYTRLINDLSGAPPDKVANAFINRGWIHYRARRFETFLLDTEKALAIQPKLGIAAFNRCLAFLALGRDLEALEHYRKAVVEFPKDIQVARKDIEEAIGKWLTPERAKPVLEILDRASS
jgi:tetratricopeptide (TPR) repeat protein